MIRIKEEENPMKLGKYQEARKENIKTYKKELLKQIVDCYNKKKETINTEKEIDKLRVDCMKLEHQKELIEDKHRYIANMQRTLQERNEYLSLQNQRRENERMVKERELEHMKGTERNYKKYLSDSYTSQQLAKNKMAAQLKKQITEKSKNYL